MKFICYFVINCDLIKLLIDSSANSSPKRTKRPLSLVCEYNQLPAITESTELQSLNNQSITTPQPQNGNLDLFRVSQWNGKTNVPSLDNGKSYKIDPEIVKKAEELLGGNQLKTTSLDNTDLTITSLNYIDEYQNTVNGRNLQNLYIKSPDAETK